MHASTETTHVITMTEGERFSLARSLREILVESAVDDDDERASRSFLEMLDKMRLAK